MEDWEDVALNHRRIPHGRSGKRGGKGGAFDARKSLGVYELRGTVIDRVNRSQNIASTIEIHGQTDHGQGLVGSVNIGHAMRGMLLLAGSRSKLNKIVREAEEADEDIDPEEEKEDETNAVSGQDVTQEQAQELEEEDGDAQDAEDHQESDGGVGDEESPSSHFEKNTFRSPKFWVQWRANVKQPGSDTNAPVGATDKGYFVFSGNDCKTFRGTLTCTDLGWKNAAITGHKIHSNPSDCPTSWTDVAL